jgi:hypothetical protein
MFFIERSSLEIGFGMYLKALKKLTMKGARSPLAGWAGAYSVTDER